MAEYTLSSEEYGRLMTLLGTEVDVNSAVSRMVMDRETGTFEFGAHWDIIRERREIASVEATYTNQFSRRIDKVTIRTDDPKLITALNKIRPANPEVDLNELIRSVSQALQENPRALGQAKLMSSDEIGKLIRNVVDGLPHKTREPPKKQKTSE
jgi:hypothetical protein